MFLCDFADLLIGLLQIVARKWEPKLKALSAWEKMATIAKRVDRVIAPRGNARSALQELVGLDSHWRRVRGFGGGRAKALEGACGIGNRIAKSA